MADDTTTIVATDPSIKTEPVPENIADVPLAGFNAATEDDDVATDGKADEEVTPPASDDQSTKTDEVADATNATDTPSDDDADKQPEQPEEKPADDPEAARKAHNAEMAAQRVEAKKQRDYVTEERAKIREAEQTADPTDQARRLEILEAKQYVDTIERNRRDLINDNLQAQSTFDLFNPSKPDSFNEKAYNRAIQRFNEAYAVTDQETGALLGAQDRNGNNVSLFLYLQQEAAELSDILGASQVSTKTNAQRAESKMRAKAVNPSNTGKIVTDGDELDELFEKVKDISLV